ncbi:hypothetical protein [Haloechinothrix halophila]|uniref:hypothetical protein n=1 Tax=Haloechinothrix halophila TaxID=1069073 RepID=UPI0004222955|nr:hypothetical protein [Haloechinothrix halophila]
MMRRLRWVVSGLLFAVAAMALSGCTVDPEVDPYSSAMYYDGAPIPRFTSVDAENLAGDLADAEQRHGMCFGWSLLDGSTNIAQTGSSRGPDIDASTCESYAIVRLSVGYTSESSEFNDAAGIEVFGSPDHPAVNSLSEADFERLGITREVMVDDPVAATGHAALALPLLLIEAGELEPVDDTAADTNGAATATARPLPDAGGTDFPITGIVSIGLFGLSAVGAVVTGVVMSRKTSSGEGSPPTS